MLPLEVEGATVVLGGSAVLNGVTFSTEAASLVAVVGPNGAGKSTLLNAIAGLVPLRSGRISALGSPPGRAGGRVAYVPQRDRMNWRVPVTVEDVVFMGRTRQLGLFRRPGPRDRDVVCRCLERVGMTGLARAAMDRLSGGQRQRVFLARALAQEADLFLLDEALGAVDLGAQQALIGILREISAEGRTILLATHDITGVAQQCDSCLCLNRHVCAYGPPGEALNAAVLAELYSVHADAAPEEVAGRSRG